MKARRSLLFYPAWILLSLVIVVLAVELGFRAYLSVTGRELGQVGLMSRALFRPTDVPGLYYETNPFFHEQDRVRYNSHGFRSPPFPENKPPGERRVFIVGDSVPFGWTLENDQTMSAVLSAMIRSGHPGERVRVVNASVIGYNASQMLAQIEHRLPAFDPDLLIVILGPNDFEPPILLVLEDRVHRFLFRASLCYRMAYYKIALMGHEAGDAGEAADWKTANQKAVLSLAERARAEPGRWLIALWPRLDDQEQPKGYRELQSLLHRAGVDFLELEGPLRERFGTLEGLDVDGDRVHPDAEAAAAVAAILLDRLEGSGFFRQ